VPGSIGHLFYTICNHVCNLADIITFRSSIIPLYFQKGRSGRINCLAGHWSRKLRLTTFIRECVKYLQSNRLAYSTSGTPAVGEAVSPALSITLYFPVDRTKSRPVITPKGWPTRASMVATTYAIGNPVIFCPSVELNQLFGWAQFTPTSQRNHLLKMGRPVKSNFYPSLFAPARKL